MYGFWVELRNSGGVIDRRFVRKHEEIQAAVIDIISGVPYLMHQDSITVTEGWSEE